jgi:hypothetical protein
MLQTAACHHRTSLAVHIPVLWSQGDVGDTIPDVTGTVQTRDFRPDVFLLPRLAKVGTSVMEHIRGSPRCTRARTYPYQSGLREEPQRVWASFIPRCCRFHSARCSPVTRVLGPYNLPGPQVKVEALDNVNIVHRLPADFSHNKRYTW